MDDSYSHFQSFEGKVGISLLKPANVSAFGRKLSHIPGLIKDEIHKGSVYLVKKK